MPLTVPARRRTADRRALVLVVLLLVGSVVVTGRAEAAGTRTVSTTGYVLTELDLGFEGTGGMATARSRTGQIVGAVDLPPGQDRDPRSTAARWSGNLGTLIPLSVGSTVATATDVNSAATVVGDVEVDGVVRAFRLLEGGDRELLAPADAGAWARATGVDTGGTLAGTYVTASAEGPRGFVALPGAAAEPLPPSGLPGAGDDVVVTDVGSGVVTGHAGDPAAPVPFVLDLATRSYQQVATSTGTGMVLAVSDGGTEAEWLVGSDGDRALLWSVDAPTSLPTLLPRPPRGRLVPTAVTSGPAPTVVGHVADTEDGPRAFVWSQGLGLRNLGTLGGATSGAEDVVGPRIVGWADTPTGRLPVEWDLDPGFLPVVRVLAPVDGVVVDGPTATVELLGGAHGPDGPAPDDQLRWTSDRSGPLGQGGRIVASLPTGVHVVTLTVALGGRDFSDSITVTVADLGDDPPTVTIDEPTATDVAEGEALTFAGRADDPQDGDLSSALVWTSDRDGQLFTGERGTVDDLSAGIHVVTASVTDTDGNEGGTSLVVMVQEGQDPVVLLVLEGLAVGDVVSVVPPLGPVLLTVAETIGVDDTTFVRPPLVITLGETIGVDDTTSVRPPIVITLAETIGVDDTTFVRPPIVISLAETIGVAGTTTVRPALLITVDEGIGVDDTTSVRPPIVISLAETIGVDDGLRVLPSILLRLTTTIGVADLVDVPSGPVVPVVRLDAANPIAVDDGGPAPLPLGLTVTDLDGTPIAGADVTLTLRSIVDGDVVLGTCTSSAPATGSSTCTVDPDVVAVGVHRVVATAAVGAASGSDLGVLVVRAVSEARLRGRATAPWPDGGEVAVDVDATSNRRGVPTAGTVSVTWTSPDGGTRTVASTELDGLAVVGDLAVLSARLSTPVPPGLDGAQRLLMTLRDGRPDQLWVRLEDGLGRPVAGLALDEPAEAHAIATTSGSLRVSVADDAGPGRPTRPGRPKGVR